MSKYYYHGVKHGVVLDKALEIFQSGGIKCITTVKKIGFNSGGFVSVCKKEKEEDYKNHSNNGFYHYVQDRICFIISDEIETIKPEIIEYADRWDRFELIRYINSKPNTRFSDMFDEWQVRGGITFSSILAIGIPKRTIGTILSQTENGLQKLQSLMECAEAMGLDIVDSSDPKFVEKYEKEKENVSHDFSNRKALSTVVVRHE